MIVRAAAEGPMIFAIVFAMGRSCDAGDATAHVAVVIEFPVFIPY